MKLQSGYAFALMLLLASCGGGDGSSGTTKFNLAISDAPVDSALQVCIAIEGLKLHQIGGTNPSWNNLNLRQTTNSDGCLPNTYQIPENNMGNPEFLYLDLLKYRDGDTFALLSNELISSGDYSQLRLTISDGRENNLLDSVGTESDHPTSYVKTSTGVYPLYVPSDAVKLLQFTAPIGGEIKYQLEFNLRHALVFTSTGIGDLYKLKPTGVSLLNVDSLSRITGTVSNAECNNDTSNAYVYLYKSTVTTDNYKGIDYTPENSGPVTTSSITDGNYALHFIEPGSYKVVLVCNADEDGVTDTGNSFDFTPSVGNEIPIDVPTPTNPDTNNVITVNIPSVT